MTALRRHDTTRGGKRTGGDMVREHEEATQSGTGSASNLSGCGDREADHEPRYLDISRRRARIVPAAFRNTRIGGYGVHSRTCALALTAITGSPG